MSDVRRPIVMMSNGVLERMHTTRWLNAEGPFFVVTHDADRARRIAGRTAPLTQIVITGSPDLIDSRNAGLELVDDNEWFIGLDDNIPRIDAVRADYYGAGEFIDQDQRPTGAKTWREVYRTDATARLRELAEELIVRCEAQGTIYGGFASMENPFFRLRKWSSVRFVKSKLFVMKKVPGLQWGGGNYAHDSWMSAYAVAKYGSVVVNNWVHPVHKMYEAGGLGHGRDRRPHLDPALEAICAQFEGLVAKGKGENTALRFLRTNEQSVRQWQSEHLFWEDWKP